MLTSVTYAPEPQIIERYARLLVEFALGGGNGIKPGDVVQVYGSEACKPLYLACCRAVWRAGGHVIQAYRPSEDELGDLDRSFYELAGEAQLDFLPATYWRGLIDQIDHDLVLYAPANPRSLDGVDPTKQMRRQQAMRPVREWEQLKENRGEFSWTVVTYGTPGLAAEAGLSLEQYWEQIISACFLDDPDPISRWRETQAEIHRQRDWLNSLPVERLHVEGDDADLWIRLGERRRWEAGVGPNVPSFEVFTSPDWRGTEGWIRFNQPLYAFGSLVKGVELEFHEGRVIKAIAAQNEPLLTQLVATAGADRIGEFSLTDASLSRIDRFMADTLYDENAGGPFGNTHIALGNAYQDTYAGDPATLTDVDWEALGFNQSAIHEDIVSTTDRTVTAVMRDGSERVIYAGGHFQLDAATA